MALVISSCASVRKLIAEPTAWATVSAVKEVLNYSTFRTIDKLSQMNEDGLEDLLLEEIRPVLFTLKTLGLNKEIDQAILVIGKASDVALKESKGIMADVIKEVKFEDTAGIILGGE